MSKFFQDLWESIFTPGPTPSLLLATNATFACLQLVLLTLLVATYSVHFIILSALCGGLWWAINWFAAELRAHQRREEAEKARAAREAPRGGGKSSDSETEVETVAGSSVRVGDDDAAFRSKEVEPLEARGEVKHRTAAADAESTQGSKSSASTEDEWEKVSENENEKDK